DRKTIFDGARRDAQVAAGGDRRAAARAGAVDRGDGRHAAALDRVHHAIDALLIGERVRLLVEGAELRDVGARGKGLVAPAAHEDGADRAVLVRAVADLGQPLVHRKRQGIARLRAVEGHVRDAVAYVVEELVHG